MQSAVGKWCLRRREAPAVNIKKGRTEVSVGEAVAREVARGMRPEPEEEPRTNKAKGLKRVTNIFTVDEPEGSKREASEDEEHQVDIKDIVPEITNESVHSKEEAQRDESKAEK